MFDVRLQGSTLCLLLGVITLEAAGTNDPVRMLGNGLYQVGHVMLDQSNRLLRLPAAVQMREETVEYVLVHKSGKTHESIFRTEARPRDIQVATLLLGGRPVMTNSFGADGKAQPEGSKVWLEARWTNANGAPVTLPLEELVLNKETRQPMSRGEWIYNGSNFSENAFTAERDGSIVSIHIDPDALINNPRPGRENDDLHAPNAAKLPRIGTPVEITIRLEWR